jgi:hypothetical protein
LAKGEITFAAIDPELDEHRRLQRGDKVISKVEMAGPRADAVNARFEAA